MVLSTAPTMMPYMDIRGLPSARTILDRVTESTLKGAPIRMTEVYSLA